MIGIYKIEREKLKEVKKILDENPYGEKSFAKVGYYLREGDVLGKGKDVYYLIIDADEEFIKYADERLKEYSTKLEGDEYEEIKKKHIEIEEQAQSGFGALFG